MNETSVWLAEFTIPRFDPAGPLPARVDTAVIGGGVCGLAAALALARQGAQVALLEAETIGWGASSRSGGMVLSGLKLAATDLLRRYGPERARQLFAASLAAIDLVAHLVAEEQIDCNFVRSGHLLLAAKASHLPGLVAEGAVLHRHFGHETQVLTRSELPGEIGSRAYHAGLLDTTSAAINPARYVAGLAHAARRAGAVLYEQTAVQRLRRERGGWCIITPRGMLRAREVLVATGGYTHQATPRLRRRVVPLGSYSIATAQLTPALANQLVPRGRMLFDSLHLLHYFRLTPDYRLLFGGRAAFFPAAAATVRRSTNILRREMLRIFPQLADTPIEHAWGGTLDVAFDLMPHAGQQAGLHYALGFAGHGLALATYLGTEFGHALAGAGGRHPFGRPLPRAPLGLYRGYPWFLPLAGAWYWLRDRFG